MRTRDLKRSVLVVLSCKHTKRYLVLVVVVVNLQVRAVQVQAGRDAENDVLIQAVAARNGVTEFSFRGDRLYFPADERQHVGLKWTDQGLHCETFHVQSDGQLIQYRRYRLAIYA